MMPATLIMYGEKFYYTVYQSSVLIQRLDRCGIIFAFCEQNEGDSVLQLTLI